MRVSGNTIVALSEMKKTKDRSGAVICEGQTSMFDSGALGANRNSLWLADLRPVVTDIRLVPSHPCMVSITPGCGFDSRRLHLATLFPRGR